MRQHQKVAMSVHCDKLIPLLIVYLLWFYVLATSKFLAGQRLTCDSVHSWRRYSAAPLGIQAVSTMTWYSIQPHYSDTEPTSPCPILITLRTYLARNRSVSILKSVFWHDQGSNPWGLDFPISQNGRRTLYSFAHSVWSPSWYNLC